MDEVHIYYLPAYQETPVDCGVVKDLLTPWYTDFERFHYFFAIPTLLPIVPTTDKESDD